MKLTAALSRPIILVMLGSNPSSLFAQTPAKPDPRCAASESWPPYTTGSFWNAVIPIDAPVRRDSAALLGRIPLANAVCTLTSDVTQNSYPIYLVDDRTPTAQVAIENYFSFFEKFESDADGVRRGAGHNPTIPNVPIPPSAKAGGGSDDQVLFWNPATGAEWSLWQFSKNDKGYAATNGYLYNTRNGTGRMAGSGRGAGVSKLGGTVSACEVEIEGAVEHAIAFAYEKPSPQWVFPATKSDGHGKAGAEIPQGARIQLDPKLMDADFDALGLGPQAKVIARAMQKHGLILIDRSGRPKAFLESDVTGKWKNAAAMEHALRPLTLDAQGKPDWSRFRVLDWDQWTGGPLGLQGP